MSEYVIIFKNNVMITGFLPDVWMVNNSLYHYKKCCIQKKNFLPADDWKTVRNRKVCSVKCSVCGQRIYAADAVEGITSYEEGKKYIMGL